SRRRHTISKRDWSSDVCSSDLCLIPLVSCQNQPEQMSVLDNIEEISVSESEGYGGVNEDFFAVLKDDDVTSAIEEMMYDAKGRRSEERRVGKGSSKCEAY